MSNVNDPFAKADAKAAVPPVTNDTVNEQVTATMTENKNTQPLATAAANEQAKVSESVQEQAKDLENGSVVYHVEHDIHALTITVEKGLNYNFIGKCSCNWEGRFVDLAVGEHNAMKHIAAAQRRIVVVKGKST
jgi:hypothetical protein